MGEESIFRCDACKDTLGSTEEKLAEWCRVTVASVVPLYPNPVPVNTPLHDVEQRPPVTKVVCHKASCWTKLAKVKGALE